MHVTSLTALAAVLTAGVASANWSPPQPPSWKAQAPLVHRSSAPLAKAELFRGGDCPSWADAVVKAPEGTCMPLPGTNKFFSIECSPQNEPVYTVPTQRGASKAYADDKYTSALPPVTVVVPKDTPYDVDGDWGFNYDENDRPYPITPAVPTAADDEDGPESEEVMPTPPGEADDDGADAGAATTATGTEGARRLRSTSSWSAPPPPSSPSFSVESEDAVVSLCKDSSCKSECKQMIVTKSNTCTPIKPRNWLYGVPTHTAFAPKCLKYADGYCARPIPERCIDITQHEEYNSWAGRHLNEVSWKKFAPAAGHESWAPSWGGDYERRAPNCTDYKEVTTDKCLLWEKKVECESPKAYQTYDSHKWLDESEWGVKASNWQPNAVWTAPEKPKCKFTPVCSKFLTTRVCSRVCYPGYCAKSVSPSCAVFEKDAFRGVRVSCPVKSTRDVPSWRN